MQKQDFFNLETSIYKHGIFKIFLSITEKKKKKKKKKKKLAGYIIGR